MARRTRRQVERQWLEWLEGLKLDQIEHVLLALCDERQTLNDTLRRLRARVGKTVSDRDLVNLKIEKARRRLAQLADRR